MAPVDVAAGLYGLSFERALTGNFSVLLRGRYTNIVQLYNNKGTRFSIFGFFSGEQYMQNGFDVELSFRKYFRGKIPMTGFYIQPSGGIGDYRVRYAEHVINFIGIARRANIENITFSERLKISHFSFTSGVQTNLGKRFLMDVGMGIRRNKTLGDIGNLPKNNYLNGVKFVFNLKLGYAF